MSKNFLALIFLLFFVSAIKAQPDRWQQKIKYTIAVNVNVNTNQFTGTEKIDYWNNSPDTLYRIFFHLYWNAFQPGSMMDVRSRELGKTLLGTNKKGEPVYDWDDRVKDRISKLQPNEIGYQNVKSLKINGAEQKLIPHETILEVALDKPILPNTKTSMDVAFDAQVPLQVRRSGRDNAEGIRYSMSQWYPKVVEYDYQGWNANPYIAREFYGVWGDYDVNITIDKTYMLAGSGTLQNPNEIGFGYQADNVKIKAPVGNTLTWKFSAQNVHDFVWAADPDYVHISRKLKDSLIVHVFYKPTNVPASQWEDLLDMAQKALPFIEKTFGPYPYKQYSFIHGGDGGMEYPMATLIISPGAAVHEFMHSWYQGMLGTNESLYAWMDEGFTDYADERVSAYLENNTGFALADSYAGYYDLVKSGKEEPLTTHADHFNTNFAYVASSYSKGAVFLEQLGYIVGAAVRDKILLAYYRLWRFKHPNVNDFMRVAENESDLELDWYREYFVNTTRTIDYAVDSLWAENGKTKIRIRRIGMMPMPVDLQLSFKDGTKELHYVPLNLMYGEKPVEDPTIPRKVYEAWKWTNESYVIETDKKLTDIVTVEIDPSFRMADIDRKNNKLELKW